ncbi:hypothetical protein CJ030_MR3G012304 [Morella rubra]|uniref:Uncharacterized protein n=1 Tax=Morella rubra TaxID=262757 RepID=A0A6A1W739_9ROSI|nr:hypothetical protein CJ030_MR3G012304 [Morella rubra]
MNTAYRTHRNRMFQHYSVFNSKEEALEHPYPDMNKEEWTSVCDLFASEEFQRRSAINKENRAKLKIVHTLGARLEEARLEIEEMRARQMEYEALLVKRSDMEQTMQEHADDGATEERRRAGWRSSNRKKTKSIEDDEEQQRNLVEQQERRMQLMEQQMREQMMEQIRQLQSRTTPKRKFG